jgi:Legionella pneumophila major outer membrane protein precursor
MGTARRIAIAVAVGWAALSAAQDSAGRVTILPPTELAPVADLTPPEFLRPPPLAVDDRGPPPGGWYAGVEFLYFTPRERGLDFALVDPRDDLVPAGTTQSLNLRPAPGLRASLGYVLPGLRWDLGFTYTYFTATDEFGTAAPPGGLLYPTLTRPGLTDEAQTAAAHARLTLNMYDITAGRTLDVDDAFRVRLFGGVRLATISQDFSAAYSGRDADYANVDIHSRYNGYGPIFGAETGLSFGNGLGLFGRMTGGLLTGTATNPLIETNNAGATVYTAVGDHFALTVPVLTLGVGITYEYRGFFVRAGYEVTNFFNLFERPTFVDSFAEGKFIQQSAGLALDGFFVQIGLSF